MSAEARDPRLTSGFVVSALLHGGLIAAFITLRPGTAPPAPPMFKVQLIAMPRTEPAAVVATTPPAAPVKPPPETKKVAPTPKPPVVKPKQTKPAAVAPPAPTPTPATPPANPAAGGRGTDVTTLITPGVDFPYPAYINRITNEIIKEFQSIHQGSGALRAVVSFTIRRDGSVSSESIRLVSTSGVYSFNQDAIAAVEAAANRNAFGALPPGFREDILPVRFSFDPTTIRR